MNNEVRKKNGKGFAFPFFTDVAMYYLRRRYAANANAKAPKIAA